MEWWNEASVSAKTRWNVLSNSERFVIFPRKELCVNNAWLLTVQKPQREQQVASRGGDGGHVGRTSCLPLVVPSDCSRAIATPPPPSAGQHVHHWRPVAADGCCVTATHFGRLVRGYWVNMTAWHSRKRLQAGQDPGELQTSAGRWSASSSCWESAITSPNVTKAVRTTVMRRAAEVWFCDGCVQDTFEWLGRTNGRVWSWTSPLAGAASCGSHYCLGVGGWPCGLAAGSSQESGAIHRCPEFQETPRLWPPQAGR